MPSVIIPVCTSVIVRVVEGVTGNAVRVVSRTVCDLDTVYTPAPPVSPETCRTIVPPAAVLSNIPRTMVPDTIPLIIRFVVRILPTKMAFGAVPPTNMTSFVGLGTQQSVVFVR